MNEEVSIERYQQLLYAPVIPTNLTLDEIKQFAVMAVQSKLFKDATDVAKAAIKIKAGQEMGMGMFEAMASFNIIRFVTILFYYYQLPHNTLAWSCPCHYITQDDTTHYHDN